MQVEGFLQDKFGSGKGAFCGIDKQEDPVDHLQRALYLTAEVGVAGSVDDVDLDFRLRILRLVEHRCVLRENRDAAFLFEVV